MQQFYEHSVPKMEHSTSLRKVLVFRQGTVSQCKDNSHHVLPGNQKRIWYGQPSKEMDVSEGSVHSRLELSDLKVHE